MQADTDRPDGLTETQAARILCVSVRTLQRWRWSPPTSFTPPPWAKLGGRVVYSREALREYMREQQRR